MTIAVILKYVLEYWRQIAIGLGLLILMVAIGVSVRSCKSRTEKRIEDRQPVIVEQQQGANQALNAAVSANQQAKDAQNAVNRVQKDKRANVSIDEANRNRCIAFPESCK